MGPRNGQGRWRVWGSGFGGRGSGGRGGGRGRVRLWRRTRGSAGGRRGERGRGRPRGGLARRAGAPRARQSQPRTGLRGWGGCSSPRALRRCPTRACPCGANRSDRASAPASRAAQAANPCPCAAAASDSTATTRAANCIVHMPRSKTPSLGRCWYSLSRPDWLAGAPPCDEPRLAKRSKPRRPAPPPAVARRPPRQDGAPSPAALHALAGTERSAETP
mmetsp:Transcript_23678/g.76996  ORF Transcript_23678/g.76996 Transcript_23678/m.76996 type:complete len:219 (-) Transcript_23678:49-705(-)